DVTDGGPTEVDEPEARLKPGASPTYEVRAGGGAGGSGAGWREQFTGGPIDAAVLSEPIRRAGSTGHSRLHDAVPEAAASYEDRHRWGDAINAAAIEEAISVMGPSLQAVAVFVA